MLSLAPLPQANHSETRFFQESIGGLIGPWRRAPDLLSIVQRSPLSTPTGRMLLNTSACPVPTAIWFLEAKKNTPVLSPGLFSKPQKPILERCLA